MSIINRYVIFAAAAVQGGLGLELQPKAKSDKQNGFFLKQMYQQIKPLRAEAPKFKISNTHMP